MSICFLLTSLELQQPDLLADGRIPELDHAPVTCRGEVLAVGRPRDDRDLSRIDPVGQELSACQRVPDLHLVIAARQGQLGLFGPPISIKLRKEELKAKNTRLSVIESDRNNMMSELSPKGVPYGEYSTSECVGAAVFSRAAQRAGAQERLCAAQHGALRWAGQLVEGPRVEQALWEHFPGGVYLQDGSVVSLPHELSHQWRGSGGVAGRNASGVRIQARWEMRCGGLHGLWMQDARASERRGPAMEVPYPEDSLRIVDTAYLSYADMRAESKSRRSWITGVKADMLFRDGQGRWWNLTDWVGSQPDDAQVIDQWVQAGKADQVPVRLIAVRLPQEVGDRRQLRATREVERRPHSKGVQQCGRRPKRTGGRHPRQRARKRHKVSAGRLRLREWLLVVTNVDESVLDARQVVALMRLRWQIELFWKLCKQEGKIDTWRSSKPERILTELYAKLLGVLLEHWVTIEGCWADPRRSLFKARQVIQWTVSWLVLAIVGAVSWKVVFARMCAAMRSNCWTDRRRHPPSTFQQLENPQLCGS